jgi:hypothetical protein
MKLHLVIALLLTQFSSEAQHPSCRYYFKLFNHDKNGSLYSIKRNDSLFNVASLTFRGNKTEDNYINRVIGNLQDSSQTIWEIEQLPFRDLDDFLLQIVRNSTDTMNIIVHKYRTSSLEVVEVSDTIVFKKGNFLISQALNNLKSNNLQGTLRQEKIIRIEEPLEIYIRKNYR